MLLTRIDPTRHMNRWYNVTVQATLFDPWLVVCEWGSRSSASMRVHVLPAESLEEAMSLAENIITRKLKQGYRQDFLPATTSQAQVHSTTPVNAFTPKQQLSLFDWPIPNAV
jgi:predicted DNA-binding WGR domain protein